MNFSVDEEEAPPPVSLAYKALAMLGVLALVVVPMIFLLLFGTLLGKKTTRSWFLGTLVCLFFGAVLWEPVTIAIMNVHLPLLIRRKLKLLADPTTLSRFPYVAGPLHEHPTTYLATGTAGVVDMLPGPTTRNYTVPVAPGRWWT